MDYHIVDEFGVIFASFKKKLARDFCLNFLKDYYYELTLSPMTQKSYVYFEKEKNYDK